MYAHHPPPSTSLISWPLILARASRGTSSTGDITHKECLRQGRLYTRDLPPSTADSPRRPGRRLLRVIGPLKGLLGN
eukprot:3819414-Pyramimonas_sp.AAC.1